MASIQTLLQPQVLTNVIAQVVAEDTLLQTFGMQPGGLREVNMGHGRYGVYHVYNDSRKVALTRSPASGMGTSAKQPMQAIAFEYPRMGDSVFLEAEKFNNLGKISDPATRDAVGREMLMRQEDSLGQKARNWRKVQLVGMLKDSLYVQEDGDDWHLSYTSTSAAFQIQSRIPSGNKDQLNMTDRSETSIYSANIITVPWDNAEANVLDQFAKIDKARAEQGVGPVTDLFLNSITWRYLTANASLAAEVGIANQVYETFTRQTGVRADGDPLHELVGRFSQLPGKTFHISDQGCEVYDGSNHTWTPDFADGEVIMTGNPLSRDRYAMMIGGEPVSEYDNQAPVERFGLYSWSKQVPHGVGQTTGTHLFVQDNALALAQDPYDVIYATVTGF